MLSLVRRAESSGPTVSLLITLIVLVLVGSFIAGILYLMRRQRRSLSLPLHDSRHRSLTVTAIPYGKRFSTQSERTINSPTSPVPEIRITFPEEEGPDGRRKSGRVVIVQVSEAGAAFVRDVPASVLEEEEESLPKYTVKTNNSKTNANFDSVDLDKVGGLKEKYDWV